MNRGIPDLIKAEEAISYHLKKVDEKAAQASSDEKLKRATGILLRWNQSSRDKDEDGNYDQPATFNGAIHGVKLARLLIPTILKKLGLGKLLQNPSNLVFSATKRCFLL